MKCNDIRFPPAILAGAFHAACNSNPTREDIGILRGAVAGGIVARPRHGLAKPEPLAVRVAGPMSAMKSATSSIASERFPPTRHGRTTGP